MDNQRKERGTPTRTISEIENITPRRLVKSYVEQHNFFEIVKLEPNVFGGLI